MIENFFQLKAHNTNVRTEVLAGLTSFLACAYIIVVNPSILAKSGMPFNAVLTATILVSFFSSVLMGLYANNPIIVAPGMGINAFFTYSLVLGMNVPFQTALGAVFWSGLIFLLLSLVKLRDKIAISIPKDLRLAIAGGIGLFIALIGLSNAQFVVPHPATIVTRGPLTPAVLCFLFGLLATAFMLIRRIPGAMILGMTCTTLLAATVGRLIFTDATALVYFQGIFSWPDFSLIGKLDLKNSFSLAFFPAIFSFLYTDLFDSLSTFIGLAEAGGLHDAKGDIKNLKQSLISDAISTLISGPLGSSSGTAYIESATGIEQGGRTGLVAVVAGLCFLPFIFFSPLLSLIPTVATAPILVLVGVFMTAPLAKINWKNLEESIPCFLAMILIPFTYSISYGIMWGFFSYTLLKVFNGKVREISWPLWVINFLSLISLLVSAH